MAQKHDDEQLLNGELARLLQGYGIEAEAEQRRARKKLDVIAQVDGVQVVLEAETGYGKRSQAVKDADARLKQRLAVMAFAVCYPGDARVAALADAELHWLLRTNADDDWSSADWSQGGIADLYQAVRQAPASFDDVDGAAQILSQGLDAGAQRLSHPQRQTLAQALNLPNFGSDSKKPDDYFTSAQRGLLVIATAMLFHHRVHEHLADQPPSEWTGEWPPKTATACAMDLDTTIREFDRAWAAILAVDYRPIFAAARDALAALPATADGAQIVHALAQVVEQVARLVSGMRHDLLGRIFHRVLDTARHDGSYYTSTAAATLLAALAIREEDCDWSDVDAVANLRICDPACGTGTLLMAAARRIHDLRERAGKGDPDEETMLAEALVEEVLWGYDINITATHMAASALGMLSPKTQFRNMNIHNPKFGVEDGVAFTGSPDLLDDQLRLDMMPGAIRQVDDTSWRQVAEHPKDMDVVIMNPPFTRSDLRHDQFARGEETMIKAREKEILDGQSYRAAASLHSSGGMFAVLGETLTNSGGGGTRFGKSCSYTYRARQPGATRVPC